MLADLIVLVHLSFVAFVVLGGLLVLRWPWVAWIHLPAALWGAAVELFGWYCPLTPLEIELRRAAGERGYSGDFVERYVLPIVYPDALTRDLQLVLGCAVIVTNVLVYAIAWRLALRRRGRRGGPNAQ